jgi:hypothetical protein
LAPNRGQSDFRFDERAGDRIRPRG